MRLNMHQARDMDSWKIQWFRWQNLKYGLFGPLLRGEIENMVCCADSLKRVMPGLFISNRLKVNCDLYTLKDVKGNTHRNQSKQPREETREQMRRRDKRKKSSWRAVGEKGRTKQASTQVWWSLNAGDDTSFWRWWSFWDTWGDNHFNSASERNSPTSKLWVT